MRVTPLERFAPIGGRKAYLASRSDGARLHAGVDLAARQGTPVRAPEAGTIELAGAADTARAIRGWRWRGYGPDVILLKGDSGAWHVLAHLQALRVSRGDRVAVAQLVGEVSRLAHVHWEVTSESRPGRGRAVVEISRDPMAWVEGTDRPYDGRAPIAPAPDLRTPEAHRPRPTQAGNTPARIDKAEEHRGS